MAYIPTVWKNRVVEFPRRFVKQNETANSVELVPDPGVVTEEGTPVNAVNLNKIEQGIEDAHNAIDAHEGRTDNPHGVTKSQVGLGNVQNYGIASQAQAEAGSANNVYMTPLRTKQAIDTFTGGIPFRMNDGALEYYDGGAWKAVGGGGSALGNYLGHFGVYPFIGPDAQDVTISSNTTWNDASGYKRVKKLTINNGITLRIARSPFFIFADEIVFGNTNSTIDASGQNGEVLFDAYKAGTLDVEAMPIGELRTSGDSDPSPTSAGGGGGGILVIVANKISGANGKIKANGGNGYYGIRRNSPVDWVNVGGYSVTAGTIQLSAFAFGGIFAAYNGGSTGRALNGVRKLSDYMGMIITPGTPINYLYGFSGAGGGYGSNGMPSTPIFMPTPEIIMEAAKVGIKGGGGGMSNTNNDGWAGGGGGGAILVYCKQKSANPTLQANGGNSAGAMGKPGGSGVTYLIQV